MCYNIFILLMKFMVSQCFYPFIFVSFLCFYVFLFCFYSFWTIMWIISKYRYFLTCFDTISIFKNIDIRYIPFNMPTTTIHSLQSWWQDWAKVRPHLHQIWQTFWSLQLGRVWQPLFENYQLQPCQIYPNLSRARHINYHNNRTNDKASGKSQ